MRIFILFLFVFNLVSCNQKKEFIKCSIKGKIQNKEIEKLYLINTRDLDATILDSSIIIDGSFNLNIDNASFGNTYCIKFKIRNGRQNLLSFQCIDSNYLVSYFFIDTTSIIINEIPQNYDNNHATTTLYCSLKGGIENKALQTLNPIEVVGIQIDPRVRKVQIDSIRSYIAKNPGSLYLLNFIYTQKGILDKTELKSIYKLFDSSLLNSNIGKKLAKHIAKIDSDRNYKNVELLKPDNSSVKLYDSLKDLNLIIFWASWCGPCRAEIPDLKKLYNLYSKKGLRIISISIDDSRESWLRQIEKENMNWLQLSGNNTQIEKIKSEFDIVSIPVSIFVDKNCKPIKRLEGKRINSFEEYQSIIEQFINN